MEKYGTYDVYRNKTTDEILRVPFGTKEEDSPELEKVASDVDWEKLEEDPEDVVEE